MGKRSLCRHAISKCKVNKGSYHSDRISFLPDEILISIISLLPLEEAARTCVLSRRWKSLGVGYHRNLDLNGAWIKGRQRDKERKMVRWVYKVLQSHQGSTIDRLSLRFYIKKRFQVHLNRWFELLSAKLYGIKSLELDVSRWGIWYQPTDKNVSLPTSLPLAPFSSSLTYLSLKFLNVSEELLQGILNSCFLLEHLCLAKSRGSVCLQVPGSLLRLKYLEIVQWESLKKVEVYAPNLSKFIYKGDKIELFFDKVAQLTNVSIGPFQDTFGFVVDPISSCFAHLRTLSLQLKFLDKGLLFEQPPHFPAMPCLNHLVLYIDAFECFNLLNWAYFVASLPALHTLEIKFFLFWRYDTFDRVIRKPPGRCCSLKTLKILGGFRGVRIDFDFVQYLVENAAELEKLVIKCPEYHKRALSLLKKSLRKGAIIE